MNKLIEKRQMFNPNTLEKVFEKDIVKFSPWKEGEGYEFKNRAAILKLDKTIALPEVFSNAEFGMLVKLGLKTYGNTNLLAWRKYTKVNGLKTMKSEIIPYTKDEIGQIINLKERATRNILNKAQKYSVLRLIRLDKEYYAFNPIYINATKIIPIYLYLAFQKELDELIPFWVQEKYKDLIENEILSAEELKIAK